MPDRTTWDRDMLVVVLDHYFHGGGHFNKRHPEMLRLAELVGVTPASVEFRIGNYKARDPNHAASGRAGLAGGGAQATETWNEFSSDLPRLRREAAKARERLATKNRPEPRRDWIFQGNPDVFDIDRYLAESFVDAKPILWTVRQNAERVMAGDEVYLWRSRGRSSVAGIVARARVVGAPTVREDDAPDLYREGDPGPGVRCVLELLDVRLGLDDGMVERGAFAKVPDLAAHSIITLRTGTNFALSDEQGRALAELWGDTGIDVSVEAEGLSAPEGRAVLRLHLRRERSRLLVDEAKRRFQARHGRVFCEACGFDFAAAYGAAGEGFIEAHHNLPVSDMGEGGATKVEDLTLLCSNCHRIVHRTRPWLSVEGLRELVDRVHG